MRQFGHNRTVAKPLILIGGAFAAGIVFSSGFSPRGCPVLSLIALLALFAGVARSETSRSVFATAFFFGIGWFAPGLAWTLDAMIVHGRVPAALALGGLIALAALCSLFAAVAATLAKRFFPGDSSLCCYGFAGFLTIGEYLRGNGLADFGWLTPADMVAGLPLAGWAPLTGAVGINAVVFFSIAALCAAASAVRKGRFARAACHAMLPTLGLLIGGYGLSQNWSMPGDTLAVRVVQADLPVVNGFVRADPAQRIATVASLSERAWTNGAERPLLLTPEGMLLTDLGHLDAASQRALGSLLQATPGPVLFNGFRQDAPGSWRNTSFLFDPSHSDQLAFVDKRKLVPFGEYVPAGFRWFVDLLRIPLSDLTPGAIDQANPSVHGVPLGILICYENLDGEVLRGLWRSRPENRPGLLVVTSNLGWFGEAVRWQHLNMTRLRALESSRPAVSVSMNGLSAYVDEKGRVLNEAPSSGSAVCDWRVRTQTGSATPYMRFGDLPAVFFAMLATAAVFCAARAQRTRRAV